MERCEAGRAGGKALTPEGQTIYFMAGYDLDTRTWTPRRSMPQVSAQMAALGGPWRDGPALPWQRWSSAAIQYRSRLFVIGGLRPGNVWSVLSRHVAAVMGPE